MSWFILFLAGLLEADWVLGLKQSDSMSKIPYVLLAIVSMLLSLFFLLKRYALLPLPMPMWSRWVSV
ncbi:SMR family transporter [Paraglaciecola sp. 25GB23A]|uniref:SMR family transporter n=1 Tax=Paraglaciecola sp. 25GB23A TaxID=3156068 RepID=UPI0032AED77B